MLVFLYDVIICDVINLKTAIKFLGTFFKFWLRPRQDASLGIVWVDKLHDFDEEICFPNNGYHGNMKLGGKMCYQKINLIDINLH